MNRLTRLFSIILVVIILLGMSMNVYAGVGKDDISKAIDDTAEYVYKTVNKPQVGSIGGEWAVLGLARSNYNVPEKYYSDYYNTVETYVKACNGVLHEKKYTEYSRLIVALSAIGRDARNVAGYDLTYALGDYDKTIWQGMNGPIWALIALDSRDYPMPINKEAKTQATRQMYVQRILDCQLKDGGWSLIGGTAAVAAGDNKSDPDITGMALQALSKYMDQPAVKAAVERALQYISNIQDEKGGFSSWGNANSESPAQMIVALCQLGISLEDERFVKNGKSILDNLMTFYTKGKGFRHTADGTGSNQMATEQGLYALVAAWRMMEGKNCLYDMEDAINFTGEDTSSSHKGLEGRHKDVYMVAVVYPGKTFSDISGAKAHENQPAIEAMASRGIINGKTEDSFDPNANMTRAEFAAIVVRALGLPLSKAQGFDDVKDSDWFSSYVGTAYKYGIVKGLNDTTFNPKGTISRQEAAVMVSRAAGLCGMENKVEAAAIRDILAQFSDYVKTNDWAREGLAFCYSSGILDESQLNIRPNVAILRCEVAQMLYNMLAAADLL